MSYPIKKVFERTGEIKAQTGDYALSQITNDGSLPGASAKDALDYLKDNSVKSINTPTVLTVKVTGGDFTSIQAALDSLSNTSINNTTVTIQVDPGLWIHTSQINIVHPQGDRILIRGAATVDTTITSLVSVSGTAGNYQVALGVADTTNMVANEYVIIRSATGGPSPEVSALLGIWEIVSVDGPSQITIKNTFRLAAFPTITSLTAGSISCLKTILQFNNCTGFFINEGVLNIDQVAIVGDLTTRNGIVISSFDNVNSSSLLQTGQKTGITNFGNAGLAMFAGTASVSYIIISNCGGTTKYSLIATGSAVVSSSFAIITGNASGIYVFNGVNIYSETTTIIGNGGYGANVFGGAAVDLAFSNISLNKGVGIYVSGANVSAGSSLISKTALDGFGTGAGIWADGGYIDAPSVVVRENATEGIKAEDNAYIYAQGSTASGNVNSDYLAEDGGILWAASYVGFPTFSPPVNIFDNGYGVIKTIEGGSNYPTDQNVFVSTFRGDDVHGTGSILNPFKTIQAGITAALALSGNRRCVEVGPGVYTETLTINNIEYLKINLNGAHIIGDVTWNLASPSNGHAKLIFVGHDSRSVYPTTVPFNLNCIQGTFYYAQTGGTSMNPGLHFINTGVVGDINVTGPTGVLMPIFFNNSGYTGDILSTSTTGPQVVVYAKNQGFSGSAAIGGAVGQVYLNEGHDIQITRPWLIETPSGSGGGNWIHVQFKTGSDFAINPARKFTGEITTDAFSYESYKLNVNPGNETIQLQETSRGIKNTSTVPGTVVDDALNFLNNSSSAIKLTTDGGTAVAMTNKTGAASVKGMVVGANDVTAITITGDTGNQLSNPILYGCTKDNTDPNGGGVGLGELHWGLVDVTGTRTFTWYNDDAHTVIVAQGSLVGDGIITLNQVGGSGISGFITVAYTADDTDIGNAATIPLEYAFIINPLAGLKILGIVYDNAIADGSSCFVTVDGTALVLLEDGQACVRGQYVELSITVPGRVKSTSLYTERSLGFFEENKAAGTNVLAFIHLQIKTDTDVFAAEDVNTATPGKTVQDKINSFESSIANEVISRGVSLMGAITVGHKAYLTMNFSGIVESWRVLADSAGEIIYDIHKMNYSTYPTGSSICGTDQPQVSGVIKNQNSGLVLWSDTGVAVGDILEIIVDSVSGIAESSLTLGIKPF